jgi:hypothetical protein
MSPLASGEADETVGVFYVVQLVPELDANRVQLGLADDADAILGVPITSRTEDIEIGEPVRLFPLAPGDSWDVTPDGRRFLLRRASR